MATAPRVEVPPRVELPPVEVPPRVEVPLRIRMLGKAHPTDDDARRLVHMAVRASTRDTATVGRPALARAHAGDAAHECSAMDCFCCRNNQQIAALPPREMVAADDHWRIAHVEDTALPGWLVLVPRRHVTSIADLRDAEAAGLGTWQVRLSRALQAVTGCLKTYVVQFAEMEGFAHVHCHGVPRMPDLPDEHRGTGIFGYLHVPEGRCGSDQQRDDLATALRARLNQPAGGTASAGTGFPGW